MEKLFECDRLLRDTLNEWLYMCLHGSTTDIQEVAHQSNYQTVMIIFCVPKKRGASEILFTNEKCLRGKRIIFIFQRYISFISGN